MTDEKQPVEGDEKATPSDESQSEDTLLSLFEEEKKTEVTREEYDRLVKGVQKLASQVGRKSVAFQNLFFKVNPEAKANWDFVEKQAKELGKDPFDLFESSQYLQKEVEARYNEKSNDENRKKIAPPSSGGAGERDYSSLTTEEYESLTPAEQKKARALLRD